MIHSPPMSRFLNDTLDRKRLTRLAGLIRHPPHQEQLFPYRSQSISNSLPRALHIMSPSENSILTNFLLPPAPLPAIISLRQFTELFPRAYQSNPHVKVLYRELQHQRVIDIDDVKRGIAMEVKRGEKQRRQISRTRRQLNQEHVAGIGGQEALIEAEVRISLQQVIFQRLLFHL